MPTPPMQLIYDQPWEILQEENRKWNLEWKIRSFNSFIGKDCIFKILSSCNYEMVE